MNKAKFRQLETDGFCVIPNFLLETEMSWLLNNYTTAHDNAKINGYNNKILQIIACRIPDDMFIRLNNFLKDIRENSNFKTNLFLGQKGVYLNTDLVSYDWHQDQELYYACQHAYDVLSFWIPLIKPDRALSGLSVIPHSKLFEKIPERFNQMILNRGAKIFREENGSTMVRDDTTGEQTYFDFDINELSVSPVLGPGDLLLFRGDTIHKTQDTETQRISLVTRSCNGDHMITRETLESSYELKQNKIKNGSDVFSKIFSALEKNNPCTLKSAFVSEISRES